MSEQNKALVRRFYEEVFNGRNVDAIDDICARDFVDHNAMPGQEPGTQGLKQMFGLYLRAFPDMQATVEEIVAERDLVVTRFTVEATHKGELFGAPPTGKRMRSHGIDMLRIRNDKVAEAWHQGDDVVVLMQLGVKLPLPA
jgi:steroid delta-isomerase-like uncharacterized protein